jgi:Phosphoglycerate kinase
MMDTSSIPKLPTGATRKRNVFDVLEELDKMRSSSNEGDDAAKTILVRVDFNVPMDASTGRITDDSRIRGALPTIQAILRANHNAVLVSHMGRPKLVQKYVKQGEIWICCVRDGTFHLPGRRLVVAAAVDPSSTFFVVSTPRRSVVFVFKSAI